MEDEALGGGALMEELLRDFSGDSPPPPPPGEGPPRRRSHGGSAGGGGGSGTTIVHPSLLDGPVSGSALQTFPAFVEEDLEWLSNKDAFPSLDTFLSVPNRPSPPAPALAGAKRPSPVSVLDGAPPPPPPLVLQWAAGRARSRGRRRRRRDLRAFRGRSPEEAAPSRAPREKRRCWHCAAEETPQWRAGPEGPKTLCNACGVRFKSGRLVPEYRPASSPTFSSDLHSNSHRKIMEMRRRNLEELGTAAKKG